MRFITIVFGCLAYVAGLQPGPLGIFTQSKSSIPTIPSQHDYVETLQFDSDDTFYLAYDFVCNNSPCPLKEYLPISGTYKSHISQSKKSDKTYHIEVNSNEGFLFRYNVTYLKNPGQIKFTDSKTSYVLVKLNDKCKFGSKPDACNSNIGAHTQCALDGKCRINGLLNTPCKSNNDCNTMYKCRSSFCRK